jgi:hypothetical protein
MAHSGRSRLARSIVLLVAAAVAPGCVTGHLIDSGLRYEKVERYESACTDGERLIVGFVARLETARGVYVSDRSVAAAVRLRELSREPPPPVDSVMVEWIDQPVDCAAIGLPSQPPGDGPPATLVFTEVDGVPLTLYSGIFTRSHTALWVVPIVPFAVVADAVAAVPLTILALPYLFFEQ